MRTKKRKLHERLLFTEILNSGTDRLASSVFRTEQKWLLTEDGEPEDDEGGGGGGHAASLRSGEGEALRTQPALWSRATCCPTIYINSTSGET